MDVKYYSEQALTGVHAWMSLHAKLDPTFLENAHRFSSLDKQGILQYGRCLKRPHDAEEDNDSRMEPSTSAIPIKYPNDQGRFYIEGIDISIQMYKFQQLVLESNTTTDLQWEAHTQRILGLYHPSYLFVLEKCTRIFNNLLVMIRLLYCSNI
ncbi:unnamed protein product [Absidia cylindrospora]